MNKLNSLGIGPKIAGITLPWLAAVIYLAYKSESSFSIFENENKIIFFIGLALVIIGSIIYFLTIPLLLKGLKETKLVTTGTYYLCRNPLYAAILLLIVPGISLLMNSWLILTTSIVAYIVFKIFIKSEVAEMETFFGDEYRKYRAETPEFFPFPVKKWFMS
jgi:protein-S-isoprenylcysteine O-methyltransferase Ste14